MPTFSPSKLRALQQALCAHIKTLAPAAVPVLERQRGHIENDVRAALSRVGLAAVVGAPVICEVDTRIAGAALARVVIEVTISETPVTNFTGIDLYELLEVVLTGCRGRQIGRVSFSIAQAQKEELPQGMSFAVRLECRLVL